MKMTKAQLQAQHKDDKARFKQINGVMVVYAKHMRHYWHKRHWAGLFAQRHVYAWRITNHTHNLKWAKFGHLVKVLDKDGKAKSTVVITKVSDVTGSVAKKMAEKLLPVINFKNQILKDGQIVKINSGKSNK